MRYQDTKACVPEKEFDYVLYKPARGGFYSPQNAGYTSNPLMSGLYEKDYALQYQKRSHNEVKAYSIKSRFYKDRLKDYEENIYRKMKSSMECVTPEQRNRIWAEALTDKMSEDVINHRKREYEETE